MELVMGVGPMNLVITNDALYQLSYTSDFATYVLYIKVRHNASLFLIIYCFVVICVNFLDSRALYLLNLTFVVKRCTHEHISLLPPQTQTLCCGREVSR